MTDTNSIEPKPCPFCGKTNAKRHCDHASGWIGCECGVSGPRIKLDVDRYPGDSFRPNEEQKVVSAWNRRALSARASAGEGGEWVMVPREPTAWMRNQLANEVCRQINNDEPTDAAKIYATMLTAAQQPAQAGASGGGEWRPITSSKQYAEALAAGLRVEFTIFARDTYDMPPSDQDGSGGWVRQDHDDLWLDEGKHRAYYPVATPTPPAHGDGEGDYAAKWFAECRRVLEDVSTEMRATGRGDTRFRRLIESMPRQRTTRPTPEARDAARWRALIGSARIRVLGSAGLLTDTRPDGGPWNGYAHIGLELWTQHEAGNEPADAVEWLTKYTDAALALPAQGEGK